MYENSKVSEQKRHFSQEQKKQRKKANASHRKMQNLTEPRVGELQAAGKRIE